MARQSKWANFADGFNATYGVGTKIGKAIDTKRAQKDEYLDENGVGLKGDALDAARTRALADIETKYGDAAAGTALRQGQANLQGTNFTNRLNTNTEDQQTWQLGDGASGLLRGKTSAQNASAAASSARAATTNALRPGQLGLQTRQITAADLGIELAQGTLDSNIAASNSAAAEAAANAEVAQLGLANRVATSPATNAQTISEAVDATGASDAAINDRAALARLISDVTTGGYEDEAAANAAMVEGISASDMTTPAKTEALENISAYGTQKILGDVQALTNQAQEALRTGGNDALADLFDVGDVDGRIERGDDGSVQAIIRHADGRDEVISSGTGRDAEALVSGELAQLFADPLTALGIVTNRLNRDKTGAETGAANALEAQRRSSGDHSAASADFVKAQTSVVEKELELLGTGAGNTTERQEIIDRGLAAMMSSARFADATPEERTELIEGYKANFGQSPATQDWTGFDFRVVE